MTFCVKSKDYREAEFVVGGATENNHEQNLYSATVWRVKHVNMRKLILAIIFLGSFVVAGSAQEFQIACTNGYQNNNTFCCGYTNASQANVGVIKFPNFVPPLNVGVVYTWYATHPDGPKTWDTPVSARRVPLPWSGEYQVFVMIHFIDKTTLRRVSSFRSNTITVKATACEETKELGTH